MTVSREYKIFLREEFEQSQPTTLFEKLALLAGRMVKPKLKPENEKNLIDSIAFTGMAVEPKDVVALAIVSPVILSVLVLSVMMLGAVSTNIGLLGLVVAAGVAVYIYYYPSLMERQAKIRAASEIVLMTLYIAISMRHVPNLEHAIKFAAENMKGPLAWQLRKMLWDVGVRKYLTVDKALEDYIEKYWHHSNHELKEAFYLIGSAREVSPRRREELLDEAVNLVLQGSKERAKHYSQELRMPVMIINTMGILLPIIGLVMLPVITIFLQGSISPISIVLVYNVMLPIFLLFVINLVLQKRPYTFSVPDVSAYPGIAKDGYFYIGSIPFPSPIPAALIAAILLGGGALLVEGTLPLTSGRLSSSLLITFGVAFGLGIYYYLNTFQKTKLRDKIVETESEFAEALYEMGSKLGEGHPLEISLQHAVNSIQNSPISEFFKIMLRNVKQFGMTMEAAIFDRKYGAINYYPSELIRSVMKIIIKTSHKGVHETAITMVVISKYLKGMHDTEETMKDMLSETTSSLEFQAWGLAPITGGIVVALSAAMVKIIQQLETVFGSLDQYSENAAGVGDVTISLFGPVSQLISPETFQYIVGIYTIEVILIISFFFVMLTKGDEKISRQSYSAQMLLVGIIIYAVCVVILYSGFNSLLPDLLLEGV